MIQAIGIMLGFYVAMQAAVAFEVGREKDSTGLKVFAAITLVVAVIMTLAVVGS